MASGLEAEDCCSSDSSNFFDKSVKLFLGRTAFLFSDGILNTKGGIIANLLTFFFQPINSEKPISLKPTPHVIVDFYLFCN